MAKMGGMNWEGLFASQGNTLDDVRAKIGQEREGKVRQAYADAIKGGGSLNAARVARAAEQQKQLMMGLTQNLFGSKDGIIKQDPRLAKAGKRDQDRQEMMDMFSTAQSDGEITLKEKDAIVDEMLKRGYLGEAKKFHDIWYDRYGKLTARAKTLKGDSPDVGDIWIDPDGNQVKGNIIEIGGINYMVGDDGTRKQIPSSYRKIAKGMLTKSMLDETKFFQLKQDLRLNINTANRLIKYAKDVGKGGKGFQFLANKIIGNVKTAFGANLTDSQLRTQIQEGELNALIGQFRLQTVGGGVMTEKDAQRVIDVLGGNPSALRSPQVLGELLEDILKEKIGFIEDKIGQYNAQRKVGPFRGEANYPLMKMPKFNMNIFTQLKQGKKPSSASTSSSSSPPAPPPSAKIVTTPGGSTATIKVIK